MRRRAIFSAVAALMTLAAPAHAADCAPARLAAIRIGTLPDGRIVVPVTVETQALYFLLDTGGVSTTMKWDLAKEMKLPVRQTEHTLVGVGGSTLNFALAGENFSVGSLRVENKPIYVETRPLLFADGTLASDILSGYDVEIDVPQGRLNLFAPGYCAPPEWGSATMAIDISRSGHVRFPVKIDGATIDAVLDTGSAISLIGMRAAAQLGVYPNSPGLRRTRDAGKYPIYTYPFQSMEIGGLAVKNPSIAIAADGLIPSNDLVLGMDMLSQMHLAIAYGSKRLYIANIQGK